VACICPIAVEGANHSKNHVAVTAPAICTAINGGTSIGRIPAKLSVMERASVTAGLANEVEAVNQYAAVM
jgi:hypothetical protein